VEGVRSLSCLTGLKLADPDFDQPGKVDLLIGLDSIAKLQLKTLDLDTPKGLVIASSRLQHLVFGVPPNFKAVCVHPLTLSVHSLPLQVWI